MGVVTGIVLYALIWFMTLFVVLQVGVTSQSDAGQRVTGTHGSAPVTAQMKRRFLITSGVAAVIWAVIAGIILSGAVTIADIDLFSRFGLGSAR
jgi:predicted secreted protein